MEHELGLNGQQICRADQRELWTEIRSSRKKSVQRPECIRLSVVSADCICLQAETLAPHWAGKRPPEIPSGAPGADFTIPECAPLESGLNVVIESTPGRFRRQAIEVPAPNHPPLLSCGLIAVRRGLRIVVKKVDVCHEL